MILLLDIFEAMAHAILPIVAAMGAGAIVYDTISGIVLPDMDMNIDAWAAANNRSCRQSAKKSLAGERARACLHEFF